MSKLYERRNVECARSYEVKVTERTGLNSSIYVPRLSDHCLHSVGHESASTTFKARRFQKGREQGSSYKYRLAWCANGMIGRLNWSDQDRSCMGFIGEGQREGTGLYKMGSLATESASASYWDPARSTNFSGPYAAGAVLKMLLVVKERIFLYATKSWHRPDYVPVRGDYRSSLHFQCAGIEPAGDEACDSRELSMLDPTNLCLASSQKHEKSSHCRNEWAFARPTRTILESPEGSHETQRAIAWSTEVSGPIVLLVWL
jgi:hypothetical protein